MAVTILLVDDDSRVRVILRRRLESAGYQMVDAPDGEVALRLYRIAPTDVVITDIVMPEMGGRQLITELLQHYPGVRVVAISGALEHDVRALLGEAERLGALRTLPKPFNTPQLLEAVRAVLE